MVREGTAKRKSTTHMPRVYTQSASGTQMNAATGSVKAEELAEGKVAGAYVRLQRVLAIPAHPGKDSRKELWATLGKTLRK